MEIDAPMHHTHVDVHAYSHAKEWGLTSLVFTFLRLLRRALSFLIMVNDWLAVIGKFNPVESGSS